MKDHRQTLVRSFIARHQLHHRDRSVVDLSPLHRWYRPVLAPAEADYVAWTARPYGGVVTAKTPAKIWLREGLCPQDRRLAFAHEVAHHLLGHTGSLPLRSVDPWFHSRDEREAWQAAALLLIPFDAFWGCAHIEMLSKRCDVPSWLIGEYPEAARLSLPPMKRQGVFA